MTDARAGSVGRVLRLLLGVVFLTSVAPFFIQAALAQIAAAVALTVGLLLAYLVLYVLLVRRPGRLHGWPGTVLAVGPAVAVYLAAGGPGQVAGVGFIGVSLLVAGGRGDAGCEVVAIPAALLGGHARIPCLLFSPIDALERRLGGGR